MRKSIIKLLLVLISLLVVFGCDKEEKKKLTTPAITISQPTIVTDGIKKLTNHLETLLKSCPKENGKWIWKSHPYTTGPIETYYLDYNIEGNKVILNFECVGQYITEKESGNIIIEFADTGKVTQMLYIYNPKTHKLELDDAEIHSFPNVDLLLENLNWIGGDYIEDYIKKLTNHLETLLKNCPKENGKWIWKSHPYITGPIETYYLDYNIKGNKVILNFECVGQYITEKESGNIIIEFADTGKVTQMLYIYNPKTHQLELDDAEIHSFANVDLLLENLNWIGGDYIEDSIKNNLIKIEAALLESLKDNQIEDNKWIIEFNPEEKSKLSYVIIEDEFIVTIENLNQIDRYVILVSNMGNANIFLQEYNSENKFWCKKQDNTMFFNSIEDLIVYIEEQNL